VQRIQTELIQRRLGQSSVCEMRRIKSAAEHANATRRG
jgi:hypothetical protein